MICPLDLVRKKLKTRQTLNTARMSLQAHTNGERTLKMRQSLCVIFSSFLSLQCLSSHTCLASLFASFFNRTLQTQQTSASGLHQ